LRPAVFLATWSTVLHFQPTSGTAYGTLCLSALWAVGGACFLSRAMPDVPCRPPLLNTRGQPGFSASAELAGCLKYLAAAGTVLVAGLAPRGSHVLSMCAGSHGPTVPHASAGLWEYLAAAGYGFWAAQAAGCGTCHQTCGPQLSDVAATEGSDIGGSVTEGGWWGAENGRQCRVVMGVAFGALALQSLVLHGASVAVCYLHRNRQADKKLRLPISG
jgi:hypothetical protein